ncbi:hypothetical protein C8F01DRAFT_1150413 [Mycena amicta]|nr:hypothetical protein C8F01DRAFT_1150413 [Mycena amicta]
MTQNISTAPAWRRYAFGGFVITCLVGLVIGTYLTGVQFESTVSGTNNGQEGGQTFNIPASQMKPGLAALNGSFNLPVHIAIDEFEPSSPLTYVLNLDPAHVFRNTSHLSCVFLRDDTTGKTSTTSLGFNSTFPMATSESKATVLGSIAQYPWDTYSARIQIWDVYLQVPHIGSTNPPPCDHPNLQMARNLSAIDISLVVQADLLGFSTTVSLDTSDPALYPLLNITIKRDGVVMGLVCLFFAVSWSLTLAILILTALTIWRGKEPRFDLVAACAALLFALPALRMAQPGIPSTPILLDLVGYFWNIAIVGLCMFSLIVHSIIHM